MKKEIYILGAQDIEMVAIEEHLRTVGQRFDYAVDADGKRVHPGGTIA